jgi:hypothetical protein
VFETSAVELVRCKERDEPKREPATSGNSLMEEDSNILQKLVRSMRTPLFGEWGPVAFR